MPLLAAVERFFERLFERPSARIFRMRLQPSQVQQRVERAMDAGRRISRDRTLAPDHFVVHLHLGDFEGFGDMTEILATELADGALSYARKHHYTLVNRPSVDLRTDPAVERTDVRVVAGFSGRAGERSLNSSVRPISGLDEDTPMASTDPDPTQIFVAPKPATPKATIGVTDPDGRTRRLTIEHGSLTIGRSDDNDLVARDRRVSRHHGRIVGRRETLVYLDLNSSNGSRVNGEPATEVVLGIGDRLLVGDTAIVVEGVGATD